MTSKDIPLLSKGYRTFLCCPVCGREVLTVQQALYLTNAVHTQKIDMAEVYLSAHDCKLLILVPDKLETAQLSSHRIIIAPVCQSHRQLDPVKLERHVFLGCRYGEILTEKGRKT